MAGKSEKNFRRTEKKYLLTPAQYAQLTRELAPYMEADEYGRSLILSLYYDTEDYRLIRQSLEKPRYKEKLRLRSYGVPGNGDPVFLEIKKKVDGVVYKRRVILTAAEAMDYLSGGEKPEGKGQIMGEIDWMLRRYQPKTSTRELRLEGLVMQPEERTVYADGAPVQLTYKEFELLRLFLSHPVAERYSSH